MGEPEIVAFLSNLAINRNCAPGTQNQALNAIVFLFERVLGRTLGELKIILRARRKQHMLVAMTREEVTAVLERLKSNPQKVDSVVAFRLCVVKS
jgi:hypothetical protein